MGIFTSERFSIFSFVSIISLIFLMILFVGNFMGLLYILEGNFALAFLGSLLLLILYIFIIRVLVEHKQEMRDRPFNHFSYIFWVFYLLLASASFLLLVHFVNIEYNAKDSIKESAFEKINVVDKALSDFEKEISIGRSTFETKFQRKLYDYKQTGDPGLYAELQRNPYDIDERFIRDREYINVNSTVNRYMGTLNEKADMDLKMTDSIMRKNNLKYQSVFNNWERLSLMDTYSGLNKYIDDTERDLNTRLNQFPFQTRDISIEYDKAMLPLNNPIQLINRYNPDFAIPVSVVLIIHFFLILPFVFKPIRVYSKESKSKDASTEYFTEEAPTQSSGSKLNTEF